MIRAQVRKGFAFHRVRRYRNRDGSIRREMVTETILGPAEITATAAEVAGQEHKLEGLTHELEHVEDASDLDERDGDGGDGEPGDGEPTEKPFAAGEGEHVHRGGLGPRPHRPGGDTHVGAQFEFGR